MTESQMELFMRVVLGLGIALLLSGLIALVGCGHVNAQNESVLICSPPTGRGYCSQDELTSVNAQTAVVSGSTSGKPKPFCEGLTGEEYDSCHKVELQVEALEKQIKADESTPAVPFDVPAEERIGPYDDRNLKVSRTIQYDCKDKKRALTRTEDGMYHCYGFYTLSH